tara:strand:- start:140 stop:349 length:210 start_codon:yes stop_codon:yes gene_type:complete
MKKALMIIGAILFLLGGIDYIMKLTISIEDAMDLRGGLFQMSALSGLYGWFHWLLMGIGGAMFGAGKKM